MSWEHPDVQTGYGKDRGTRDQIAKIGWVIEKAKEFQKNIYFCFIDYIKTFDCGDHKKLWKILKEMGIPDHLTCLLRSPYSRQIAAVSGHVTLLIKLICRGYHEKSRLEEAQAGIKIAGRNTNNLRQADDTTVTGENEEELKSLLMKMQEERGKVGLKLNIKKTKIMAFTPITSWQLDGETMETDRLYFLGLQNHCRWWLHL